MSKDTKCSQNAKEEVTNSTGLRRKGFPNTSKIDLRRRKRLVRWSRDSV
jgi:hypothetical protein